jgi:hypothetical protein
MPLDDVAATGDTLATLQALRDTLAAAIVRTRDGRDVAALASRLTDVLERIAKHTPVEGTPLDEFAKRRAEKAASTPATRPPERARRRRATD